MNDERDDTISSRTTAEQRFDAVKRVLLDVKGACDALPPHELELYRAAQQSVSDARRSAEANEALLRVC